MLTAENKKVKYGPTILKLLQAVQLPEKIAGVHCKGYPKQDAEIIKGNNKAARRAARNQVIQQLPFLPGKPNPENYSPLYTQEELDKVERWGFKRDPINCEWLTNHNGHYFFPKTTALHALREAHQRAHYGREALYNGVKKYHGASRCKSSN